MHNGVGSRTSVDQKFDQVIKASSMTPLDVQDGSFSPDTTKDIPYELKSSKRKGGDTDEEIVISISESTMNMIMDCSESAFVSTRTLADMEDALICDGGATSTFISEPGKNHFFSEISLENEILREVFSKRMVF